MFMITINGQVYEGNNISIIGGQVTIDGKVQTTKSPLNGIVRIEVTGNLNNLTTDANVTVMGNTTGTVNAGGSVSAGNIFDGGVTAGGSVTYEDVAGDVTAGGSVQCQNIGGDVDAGGSISYRK